MLLISQGTGHLVLDSSVMVYDGGRGGNGERRRGGRGPSSFIRRAEVEVAEGRFLGMQCVSKALVAVGTAVAGSAQDAGVGIRRCRGRDGQSGRRLMSGRVVI